VAVNRILLVEDDGAVRALQAEVLAQEGYAIAEASDAAQALALLEAEYASLPFDLVVTDLYLGDGDGLALLSVAQQLPCAPAVVLVTGEASVETVVAALRGGAADYLTKPVLPSQLLQCVVTVLQQRAARLRRASVLTRLAHEIVHVSTSGANTSDLDTLVSLGNGSNTQLRVGPLLIDTARRIARWGEQRLVLTPIEHALLHYLARAPGQVHSYRAIVEWTHNLSLSDTEAKLLLKSHVRNLRRKIEPGYLIHSKCAGYMLVADPSEAMAFASVNEESPLRERVAAA
jgi:DNA-binding response OmpR family regulator